MVFYLISKIIGQFVTDFNKDCTLKRLYKKLIFLKLWTNDGTFVQDNLLKWALSMIYILGKIWVLILWILTFWIARMRAAIWKAFILELDRSFSQDVNWSLLKPNILIGMPGFTLLKVVENRFVVNLMKLYLVLWDE